MIMTIEDDDEPAVDVEGNMGHGSSLHSPETEYAGEGRGGLF